MFGCLLLDLGLIVCFVLLVVVGNFIVKDFVDFEMD